MNCPQHILMTADTVGGVWTYALELARGLTQHGVRVSLATMGTGPSRSQRAEALDAGAELYSGNYKLEWMDLPWSDVDAAGQWLLNLERQIRPDLIHLNGYVHGSLRWQAPSIVVAHSCVYSWWNAVHEASPPAQDWTAYRRRVRAGLRGANHVVAVSNAMRSEIERWYGRLHSIQTIYNSRDEKAFRPSRKEDFVLSTGRVWDAAKNLSALDEAARYTRWPVYVAGESQHPEGGKKALHTGIPLGTLSANQLNPLFACAGIYALPALYEPFGLSVLEAALSGCALVLGDIPSLRELWREAAVFVAPRDSEAIALAINALVCKPEAREEFGRRARARAFTYTRERMIQGYLQAYTLAGSRFEASRRLEVSCAS